MTWILSILHRLFAWLASKTGPALPSPEQASEAAKQREIDARAALLLRILPADHGAAGTWAIVSDGFVVGLIHAAESQAELIAKRREAIAVPVPDHVACEIGWSHFGKGFHPPQ